MEKKTLSVVAAPISFNGRELEVKSKARLPLGGIALKKLPTKEQDRLSV